MITTLSLVLAAAPALACDGPTHNTSCHLEHLGDDGPSPHQPFDQLHFEANMDTSVIGSSAAWGVSGRFVDRKDGYLIVEGRAAEAGWMGRAGAGFDVFGSGPLYLRLGLFIGNVGVWNNADYRVLQVGTDMSLGHRIGRTYGEYRFLGGARPEGQGIRTEHQLTLGYRLFDEFRVYGQHIVMKPEPGVRDAGVGLGASVHF